MLGTMLRRIGAATLPHQRAMRTSAANLFAEGSEASVGSKAYLPKFMDVAPSGLDPPTFQGDYGNAPAATAEDGTPLPIPEKVTFSLQLPHQAVYSREEVDMVLAPASTGDFGVLPGHVPTVAQLKPGVLQVHKTRDTDVTNYFINGGFAFVHANGQADVVAQECVLLEDLDPEMVKQGLAEYQSKASTANDDYERAVAQVGVEVYSAMQSALEKTT
ncbi:hypothetical protein PPROV_000879300 [Pycnococcus provasolii]|uniref:ATP synthase F1 complex delta/epsilon subunit N-terminal domain-containing protein n=1 Tax=Pycnococcus provasolii TaxID=41880 RepID=A0A830HWA9_9CHLO|nr:hypothetical protein PPROV_000879300 [Pycnococcus provasolii]